MFTDTHCHIDDKNYNIEELIKNANKNKITKMINNGCDYESNEEVLKISENYPEIYSAIGFHPQNLESFKEKFLKQIEQNIDKITAIGEIGLDYYNGIPDRNLQKEIFKKQLDIAIKYDKPVIIHSREATQDVIDILKCFPNLKGVIHCFTGSLEVAKIYINLGFKLGINGVVTFKNSNLHKVIENIDLENIVLETDSPYLTPEPYRGHKNEPAYILNIAEKICDIKNISLDELSRVTENNVESLFDI